MNHEVMMYAIAQKEQLGFDSLLLPSNQCPSMLPAFTILLADIHLLCTV
jgi:hypothetical protein